MQFLVESDIDTLVLPVAPDVSAVDVWGIVKDGLSGVWGGVDMRADETDNPSGDGILWPGIVRAGARYLGLVFAHRSHSSALAEMQARARIAGLLRRELRVQFDGPLGLQETTGFIKAMPDFEHVDMHTCTCGIVIVCPDPHWYGLPKIIRGSWGSNTSGGLEYPLYAPGVTTRELRRNLVSSTPSKIGASISSFVDDDGVSWWVFTPSISVPYIGGMRASVPLDRLEQGQPYIAGAYLHNPSTTARRFRVNWCDQGAKAVTVGAGETIALLTDPTIADYSTTYRFVDIRPSELETNREPFWLRQITVVKAPWDNPVPFDGDTPSTPEHRYAWTGTPGASESVEYETVRTGDYSGGYLYYSGVQTGHRVDVPNAGLEPTWPILRVNGATSWARFTCGTQVVEVQAQTEGLTIDTKTGEVTSQGVDVSGFLTRDDFFQIPAGGATVSFQASDPVDFEVEASPAWL